MRLIGWPAFFASSRQCDLTQVVQSGLTIAFFITPVLWRPEQIPVDKHYLLSLNPLAAVLAVVCEPLLGQLPTLHEWVSAAIFSIGEFAIALPLVGYCQRRIIYWV
jgi:ABC-type polysaccharide/polyol phosphate export permease